MSNNDTFSPEEEFINNEEMLHLFDNVLLGKIGPLLEQLAVARFIMIPKDKRLFFSSGMRKILGSVVNHDLCFSTFLQYIPVLERQRLATEYACIIDELIVEKKGYKQLSHFIGKDTYNMHDVTMMMQYVRISDMDYIVGFVIDKTKDALESSIMQLFGKGIEEYIFVYDTYNDVCYVSNKFVEQLGVKSNLLPNASKEALKCIYKDDRRKFVDEMKSSLIDSKKTFDVTVRFNSKDRGEIYLKACGLSDFNNEKRQGNNRRFISGCFTDVTEFIKDAEIRNNLIDAMDGVTFFICFRTRQMVFSNKLNDLLPGAETTVIGNVDEELIKYIIPEDRNRFRVLFRRIMDGVQENIEIEIRVKINDERYVWIACRGKAYYDKDKQSRMVVGLIYNLTKMNQVRESIERNSLCHELTGLPTRDKLLADADNMICNEKVLSLAMILVDINDFHTYNDRYGRNTGDVILIEISKLLQKRLPDNARVYQLGIDTYCILWPHATRLQVTEYMAYLQEESVQPIDTVSGSFFISYGLSASVYPSSGNSADEMLVNAEITLHKVKQDRKIKYAIYSPSDKRELRERLDFEFQIIQSIRNGMDSFQLFYQPLVDAQTGKIVGAEALLRWIAPNGGLINPEKVVGALESTDKMDTVGTWILNTAISQCANWIAKGASEDFYVHINVTADDIVRSGFADDVLETLHKYNLNAKNILLEITETSLMKSIAMCRVNLVQLRAAGVRIALDDFGTGYSSFNYLKELPVDEIKIDKTFVDDMATEAFNRSFICAVIILAHSINKKVCVEGVEDEKQFEFIRKLGGDVIQGYYFSKPLTVFNFEHKYIN